MSSDLGEYLRVQRAARRPEDAGFPGGTRRRVAGMRREEVAVAAGVSVDYYVRLEQGRESRPSPQVLDALGRVLGIDDDGRMHLFRLAGLAPSPTAAGGEWADPELLALLESWSQHPAMVLGRAYDVLGANTLGRALFKHSSQHDNLARIVFLDPSAPRFYLDWDAAARATVSGLRLAAGAAPDDLRLCAVLDELQAESSKFRELWSVTDARSKRPTRKGFLHPAVGSLTLHSYSFDVRAASGQELVVYRADPGSPSAEALSLLGSLAATSNAAS